MAILFAGSSIADVQVVNAAFASTSNKYGNVSEAIAMGDAADNVYFDLASYQSDLWLSYYVFVPTISSSKSVVLFYDTAFSLTQPIFTLDVSSSGAKPCNVKAWNGTTLTALSTAAGAFPVNVMQRIDVHIKKADSGGVAEIYANGALQYSFSGDTNVFASSGINRVQLVQHGSGAGVTYLSAIICANEDTRTMLMAQSKPTAAGGALQWNGLYSAIDENGIDDSDMIAEGTIGEVSTFIKGALPGSFSGLAVQAVVLSARGQALAGFDVAGVFRIGGTNYQLADFNMSPGFKPQQVVVAQNPATSAAWTFAAADGAEIGVKLIAG